LGLTTDYLDLDIRTFKNRGWLTQLSPKTLTWSTNGNPTGSISYQLHADSISLNYKIRINGNDWQDVTDTIFIKSTPCNFGGSRKWFQCPKCMKNVLVLYGGNYFRCRTCMGLVHQSVNESKLDRASRALARYQRKLAPNYDISVLDGLNWMTKPKWMRYRTFNTIYAKGMDKQNELESRMIDSFGVSYF
jgi:hypothetical protein